MARRLILLSILSCVALLAACKPPAAGPQPGASSGAATGPAPAASASATASGDELVMRVQFNRVTANDEETAFSDVVENPGPELIGEKVKSLNWQSAPDRPFVSLARTINGQVNSIRLQGTLETPNQDGPLRLLWYGVEDGAMKYIQTPPLDSAEAAIPLLVSYARNDGKWRTMAAWEDVPQSADGN